MRVLLWAVVGLSAILFVHGATTHKAIQTTASLTVRNATASHPAPASSTTPEISMEAPKPTATKAPTSPQVLRVQRSTKQHAQTASLPSRSSETQLATASVSAPTTTPKPPRRHRKRHGKRKTRMHRHRTTTPAALGKTITDHNFTSSASDAASTKSSKDQPATNQEEKAQYYQVPEAETEKPEYYTYSLKSTYSAKLGEPGPEFASSENYARRPVEDYEEAESNHDVKTDAGHGTKAEPKRQCKRMLKPMPQYIHYAGQVEKSSNYGSGPMMTCYVCGTKDDPYSDGGFTEECSYSPSKQYNILANFVNDPPRNRQRADQYTDQPYVGSATNDKLYAGKGHTPYLTQAQGSKAHVRPTYDQYYNDGYQGEERLPQATNHGGGGGGGYGHGGDGGGYGGDGGGGGGGHDQGGSGGKGAATEKETCKITYKGKMKCKVCGDPKSDAVFSEQCDYEKDDPNQQRTASYDYGNRGEKSYKSPDSGKGGDHGGSGGGGGDGGYGGGGDGGYGGYGGDDYGDGNGGYGGYPDYGGYGSGTGYDPYYGGDYGGGSDGGYGNDKHDDGKGKSSGSHGSDDGKYSGTRQTPDYQEQPQASSYSSDKKGSSSDNDKKVCKVVYKDFSSYYDSKSKDKSKPKMKCTVCARSDGFGGVTEECTYNGGGESAAHGNFPSGKDLSSYFEPPQLERFYSPNYDEDRDSYY